MGLAAETDPKPESLNPTPYTVKCRHLQTFESKGFTLSPQHVFVSQDSRFLLRLMCRGCQAASCEVGHPRSPQRWQDLHHGSTPSPPTCIGCIRNAALRDEYAHVRLGNFISSLPYHAFIRLTPCCLPDQKHNLRVQSSEGWQ